MKGVRSTRDPRTTSRIMARVPAKNTRPELLVRKRLWAMGYRYRVHPRDITGRPDIVFTRLRVAIFIDGDFWHGNPEEWKRRGFKRFEDMFPSRTEWWVTKIRRNIERDREVDQKLQSEGWFVIRCWESSIYQDCDEVMGRIARALEQNATSLSSPYTSRRNTPSAEEP